MLYTIIPPILIILSLAGIIIFLAKKAPKVAELDDEDELDRELIASKVGFFQRSKMKFKTLLRSIGQLFLNMLEKMTGGAKMASTKLEGKFKNMSASMRIKKNREKTRQASSVLAEIENNEDTDIINRLDQYQSKKSSTAVEAGEKQEKIKRNISEDEEEKIIRPTVSNRVVRPKARTEMKDRLEDLLIERIAANPKDVEAYERLGEYYMEIDSLIDAKECFKQVLKLDSKNGNVKYRMRRLEAMLHKR